MVKLKQFDDTNRRMVECVFCGIGTWRVKLVGIVFLVHLIYISKDFLMNLLECQK